MPWMTAFNVLIPILEYRQDGNRLRFAAGLGLVQDLAAYAEAARVPHMDLVE